MRFKSHQYRSEDDLRSMVGLIKAARKTHGPKTCNTVGAVYFYLVETAGSLDRVNPNIRIWDDESGEFVGYVWFDPYYSSLQLHPDAQGSGVEAQMLDWLEDKFESAQEGTRQFLAHSFDGAGLDSQVLKAREFTESNGGTNHYRRSLEQPITESDATTVIVRSVRGRGEVGLVSGKLKESHLKLLDVDTYNNQLDLIAVTNDNAFVAHYLGWHDSENQMGELHAIRTTQDRGDDERAVINEGLRRLQLLGAKYVVMYAPADDTKAAALYHSCGFEAVMTDHGYWKGLSPA